jgi:hypothetical protein
MYRMRRNDDGWKCQGRRCGLQITKSGESVPDGKKGPIDNFADNMRGRSIIDSMIENRYSEVGPSDDPLEEVRRIQEAGELLRGVLSKGK